MKWYVFKYWIASKQCNNNPIVTFHCHYRTYRGHVICKGDRYIFAVLIVQRTFNKTQAIYATYNIYIYIYLTYLFVDFTNDRLGREPCQRGTSSIAASSIAQFQLAHLNNLAPLHSTVCNALWLRCVYLCLLYWMKIPFALVVYPIKQRGSKKKKKVWR